ncbi:MAG TPA: SDR family NAD(P)-dependent oxidoreductase, partial [Dehalococcoidia bacterium]|nr:SDR family NAD(P)-dependent oxidoreductase [Dehalococcoidia bacterium]
NGERLRAAADEIRTIAPDAEVEPIVVDLSSLAETRRLAEQVRANHDRLHVLINNAGVIRMDRRTTVDGLEETFVINHLSHFLLSSQLLDLLRSSAPARIMNVSSATHKGATLDFDDLQGERSYGGYLAYRRSKLANILFTYELARRLEGTGVTVNCLHPGAVATRFASGNRGVLGRLLRFGYIVGKPVMRSAAKGAETSIYLATSPDVEGVTGQYFENCRPAESSRQSYDEEAARKLWAISEQLVGGDRKAP